jgi:proteasome lid subunit RPN8/RPN11
VSTPFRLLLSGQFHADMIRQAQAELPNECCGLLAGHIEMGPSGPVGRVLRRFPLVNAAASRTEFDSEPHSMFAAHKEMRGAGLDILAIYHSHPTAPPIPSRKDLERNYYGSEVVNLIVSLLTDVPEVRAWWLIGENFKEAVMELVE